MTRRDQIYKWCIYALGLFPIWVLDAFVLSRYPLLGITPTLLPLAVSAVAVLEGGDICYVAQVPSPKLLSVAIPVGSRFPAHATSLGKVLLADLPPERLEARLSTMSLRPLTARTITTRQAMHAQLAQVRKQGFVISDGELDEGSTWEAAMGAAHHELGALTAMVDMNALQADGPTGQVLGIEPVEDKWTACGWFAQRVDGNDVEALLAAFDAAGR